MFTSQLGTPDSQLGNIELGGAPALVDTTWLPVRKHPSPALPEAEPWHTRLELTWYTSTLTPIPFAWYPQPRHQQAQDNMPGELIQPGHHMRRSVPLAYLTSLPAVPPVVQLVNVPLIRRDPGAPRVLGGFTDLVVSIVNSLTHTGQIVQTGAASYKIVPPALSSLEVTPGAQPPVSPYFGILWVDAIGELHYLPPLGGDIQLTPILIDFLSGNGPPDPSLGETGFHYLDLTNGNLYKKG